MRTIVIVSLMVIAAGGCRRDAKAPKAGDVVSRPQNPPVAYIADDDPRLREASRQAQESLASFVQQLEGPHDQHINFAVKTALHEEGARSEGVWITWLRFDGKSFHGTVSNEPVHLKKTFLGSKVSVESEKVVDWLIVDNGKLQGGFTVRVLRDALQGDARKQFERSLPFKVE
jgi:uncharacterized protein YegJ (DUF2314 family)